MLPPPHIQIAGALSLNEILKLDFLFQTSHNKGLVGTIGLVYGDSKHLNEKVLGDHTIVQANQQVKFSRLVLITYFNSHEQIVTAVNKTGVRSLQLHGPIEVKEIIKARNLLGDILLIKSLPIAINISPREAKRKAFQILGHLEDYVDCFITDTQTIVKGELRFGATGVGHPWQISQDIVKESKRPVIIAGGLNPENVRDAIRTTKPFGVDVHSGVEDIQSSKRASHRTKSMILADRFIRNASSLLAIE
jgi:phosphoribosylanthranilate isomerase